MVPPDRLSGPPHAHENREPAYFQRPSRHLSAPASFLSRYWPSRAGPYPAGTGNASIRRTMLANSRRATRDPWKSTFSEVLNEG